MIDFSWIYFIGKTKLNLSFKETGRMTIYMFFKLYRHYKNTWDLEMVLTKNRMTYAAFEEKSIEDEEWL